MVVALAGTVVLYAIGWLLTGRRRDGVLPAAIVGGAIGLVLRQFDLLPGSVEAWQQVGYHLFGISFLAIGLTPGDRSAVSRGAAWIGVAQGLVFALQAVAGGLVVLAFAAAGTDLFPAFGFLAPMGLEEGPGQAVSIGGLWEASGFVDATSLGATIASVGFVVAYGFGLLALRLRRPDPDRCPDDRPTNAASDVAGPSARPGRDVVVTTIGVVVAYVLLALAVGAGAGLIGPDVRDIALGVLFFLALLVGMALRALAGRLGMAPILRPAPLQRLTIAAVDGLTVAVLGSLAWARIASRAGPLATVLVVTLVATVAGVVLLAGSLESHRFDRGVALFGTVTGTVSSGLALLSLSDPDQRGPVAIELGASVVVSAPLVLAGVALATATARGAVGLATATAVFGVAGIVAGVGLRWLAPRT